MDAPIFIVGANRSGTTLLRLMLNAHPHIAIPDEVNYFESAFQGIPVTDWAAPGLTDDEYAAFVTERIEAMLAHSGMDLDRASLQAAMRAGPATFRTPYAVLLHHWAEKHGATRWGEKTPGNLFFVDVLREMFPSARFIHMVRDPRAGVASMQRVSFFPDDVALNALIRRTFADDARTRLPSVVPASHRRAVRYEDLVTDPEATLRSLCAFLETSYHPAMLHFHQAAEQHMSDDAATAFNATATRPVQTGRVRAWETRLSRHEVAMVETICQTEMEAFGYAPTNARLSATAWAEVQMKTLYWHLQTWRNRDVRGHLVRYPMCARFRDRLSAVGRRVRNTFFSSGNTSSVPNSPGR